MVEAPWESNDGLPPQGEYKAEGHSGVPQRQAKWKANVSKNLPKIHCHLYLNSVWSTSGENRTVTLLDVSKWDTVVS